MTFRVHLLSLSEQAEYDDLAEILWNYPDIELVERINVLRRKTQTVNDFVNSKFFRKDED